MPRILDKNGRALSVGDPVQHEPSGRPGCVAQSGSHVVVDLSRQGRLLDGRSACWINPNTHRCNDVELVETAKEAATGCQERKR
jgi:hypothetical protein